MGIIEEIGRMRQQGQSDMNIASALKQRGYPNEEISNLLSQHQIKEAINYPTDDPSLIPPQMSSPPDYQINYSGLRPATEELNNSMEPSIMDYNQEAQLPQVPSPLNQSPENEEYSQSQEYSSPPPAEYSQSPEYAQSYDYNYQYPQEQYSQASNSDAISEIVEQTVSDKLSRIKEKLEKTIDMKTVTEAKLSHLDERLQRIEKIIDRLQLSIIQKVGEYMINVSDLKKELVETQKSFKTVSHHASHHEHAHQQKHHHHPNHPRLPSLPQKKTKHHP